jgi:photosystem II stability/assembly factor-like uncharacterized protein
MQQQLTRKRKSNHTTAMNSRVILIILIHWLALNSFCQIEWLSPLPTGNTLTSAWFFNEQTGIIAGNYGDVLKTSDSGQSWDRYVFDPYPETGYHFNDICFTDDQTGYLAGSRIFKTTDAGETWIHKYNGSFNDIYFLSPDSGWAAGNFGALVRTSNGGENWVSLTYFPLDQVNLHGIWFTDPQHGWAVGNGVILETSNAGTGWNFISYNNNTFYDIYFIGNETGWICGNGGTILYTTDGGDNWQTVTVPGNAILTDIYFTDPLNGWAVGDQGTVIQSTDGGLTWDILSGIPERTLYSFSLAGPQKIYLTGEGGTLLTSCDGGLTWQSLQQGITEEIYDIAFAGRDVGWAVTPSGKIFRTADSGLTWPMVYENNSIVIRTLSCPDQQHVWVAGNYANLRDFTGVILYSENGGQDWTIQKEDIQQINRITLVNSNKGWAVGNNGAIYHSDDGGDSWTRQASGCVNDLNAVLFWDDENGLAGGYDEVVQTDNGGQTWEKQWVFEYDFWFIVAFYATDPVNRIAAGEQNMYYADTEGDMWLNMNQYVNGVRDMAYSSPQYRWLAGVDGLLLRQGNEGWDHFSYTMNNLNAICFDPENSKGYVAGENGTILSIDLGLLNDAGPLEPQKPGFSARTCPNPSFGQVTLEFELQEPSIVLIELFSFTGQKVRSIDRGVLISGMHKATVDLQGITPGLYFYRITAGDKISSGKLLVAGRS